MKGGSYTTLAEESSYGSEDSQESPQIKLIHGGLRGYRSMSKKDSQMGYRDATVLSKDQMLDG
jgi:hypothetical protein